MRVPFCWWNHIGIGLDPLSLMCLCSVPRCNEIRAHKDVSPQKGGGIIISAGENNDGKEEMEYLLSPVANSLMIGPDDETSSLQDILPLIFCLSAYAVNKFVAEVRIICAALPPSLFYHFLFPFPTHVMAWPVSIFTIYPIGNVSCIPVLIP